MNCERVAVIGAGVSGLAAAKVLKQLGCKVTVYDRNNDIGGVWTQYVYPNVALQHPAAVYHFTDYSWDLPSDVAPTGERLMEYLHSAVKHYDLDVKLNRSVEEMREEWSASTGECTGWMLRITNMMTEEAEDEHFDYVFIASGLYTGTKYLPSIEGHAKFTGLITTDIEIKTTKPFVDKRVVIVGFGKCAMDMCMLSAEHNARSTTHLMRSPRWFFAEKLFYQVTFPMLLVNRFTLSLLPGWHTEGRVAAFIRTCLSPFTFLFWKAFECILLSRIYSLSLYDLVTKFSFSTWNKLKVLIPKESFQYGLRSSIFRMPDEYLPYIASGKIDLIHTEIARFQPNGVELKNGMFVECDTVVLSVGSSASTFPMLPDRYRALLEGRRGGAQLYRHVYHPRIPRMGFVGLNQSQQQITSAELGALWLLAVFRGELTLPPVEEMEECMARIETWKNSHIQFENQQNYNVSLRLQQYFDTLLLELGVNRYRKLQLAAKRQARQLVSHSSSSSASSFSPSFSSSSLSAKGRETSDNSRVATRKQRGLVSVGLRDVADELFGLKRSSDYAGVVDEYEEALKERREKGLPPLRALPVDN